MDYDQKCYDLAEYFLESSENTEEDKKKLAQAIQNAIDTWFDNRED